MKLSDAICRRRSYYALSNETSISDKKIISLLELALRCTPTPFNIQSSCLMLLLGKNHQRFWHETRVILKEIVAPKQFSKTEKRLDSFQAGHGTILFFEDQEVVKKAKDDYPLYSAQFPTWVAQANGMLQSNVWMLFEEAGLGASLQHYNPLVDEVVAKTWGIPKHWELVAQMPFGIPVAEPDEKSYRPIKERFKAYTDS